MNLITDGGPAFPRTGFWTEDGDADFDALPHEGMSLRDYLAASALVHIPALLAANDKNKSVEQIAGWAYQVADAMLLARLKPSRLEEKVSDS